MFTLRIVLSFFFIIIGTSSVASALVTSTNTATATTTTTTTVTVTSSTSTLCASLVNATSACRRRRQYWIDKPVIIALDDETSDELNQFYSSPVQNQVVPTALSDIEYRSSPNTVDIAAAATAAAAASNAAVQPSMENPSAPGFQQQFYNSRLADPFLFVRWFDFFQRFTSLLTATATTTTTSTSTATSTVTSFTTTTTKTFIISGCTPANLAFSTCTTSG